MPTYVYETTDPAKPVRRFEVKQSMRDEPLRVDPETGESVRRVISGGYGVHVPVDQPALGRLRRWRLRSGLRLSLTGCSSLGARTPSEVPLVVIPIRRRTRDSQLQ